MKIRRPILVWLAILATAVSIAAADPSPATRAPGDPDLAIQGEYEGKLDEDKWGVQIIAMGDGKFDVVAYVGGLPGAGWDGERETLLQGTGECKNGKASLKADRFSGVIEKGVLQVSENGVLLGTLKRTERTSPTLGAKPPEGALVLFDGKDTDQWKQGRMTNDGLLMAGATTKAEFQSFSAHVEFRTPFQPKARGQGRGNSGFYAQGRYEVQVLDSFGLKGENNECGGLYSIKAPDLNMCLPPLQWQTFDIDFTAAQFDSSGKKTKNARFTVKHNGVLIHNEVEADHSTTAAQGGEAPAPGPINLQDHGNPVVYRNIWVVAK
ncbi:MAG: 3-keto-disaccharide hydrolase [Verrucomicrobiales bacterium]